MRPTAKEGSAAAPYERTRCGLIRPRTRVTYSLPPVTNATFEQSPDTPTCVVACALSRRPGSETRFGVPREMLETNASVTPLRSPATRFEASERNATHRGRTSKPPPIAGE